MHVIIKTPSGATATLTVETNDTIEYVKAKIKDKLGLQPDVQRLHCADKLLEDLGTASEYSQDLMRKRPLLRPGCLAFSVSPDLAFLGSPGVVITYLPSEI